MGMLVKEISTFENMFFPVLYCINTKFSMKNHMKVGIPVKNCLENGLFSLVRNIFKKFYHTIKMKSCFTVSHCAFSLWKHIQYLWCNNISLTDWLTDWNYYHHSPLPSHWRPSSLRLYPSPHVQKKLPSVSLQNRSHPPLFWAHSFISEVRKIGML